MFNQDLICFNFVKKIRIIYQYVLIVFVLFLFATPVYAQFESVKLNDLASQNEKCLDQNTCLGMCSCEFAHAVGIYTKSYAWTVFQPHNDKLFKLVFKNEKTGAQETLEVDFVFNEEKCRIEPVTQTSINSTFIKKSTCNYQPSFCCCVPDQKTGKISDCQRQVTHTNPNSTSPDYSPSCTGVSGGKHRPFMGFDGQLNSGQCQTFQETYNAKIDNKLQAQADAQKGVNVKFETRKLNEFNISSPEQLIGRIIQVLMGFMGSIMFGLYVYAGVEWMTARGDEGKIEKAKKIMTWATAGAAVMLASYVIVSNIFNLVSSGVPK